ncbi:PQQ-binding-like beta-propeller repeat protein [Erythrobacter sp. F6033]|uniref:outer membrane protein assembly factor BamB family protein n=1 Tax=Erythrobacter sp. F6033 TaxID=2926401 RepID=UPI001FF647E4|nr:PQQ-binding-like beta-propeller repeat protein [Erythrobacter sp. F6033]MCK0127549.1 PQQ-binding-like beta-propeller repeat protein [Erythrobacter sp. F6033]
MRAIAHWVFAILLALIGLLLAVPGGGLVYLGGSPYYLLAGLATLLTAFFVFRRSPRAILIYGAILALTVVWSLFEAGLDLFALLPRLAAWLVVGLYFLTPWYRQSLRASADGAEPLAPNRWLVGAPSLAGAALMLVASIPSYTQNGTGTVREEIAELSSDWRSYGNTGGGTRFAAIDDITPETVGGLKEVWRYRTGSEEDFKATPLQIGDNLYFCAAANVVIALNAETGEEVWKYDPKINPPDEHQYAITCRGVAYHEASEGYAGQCPARIVTATVDASLIALDAQTGALCEDFGENGIVDLRTGMGEHLPKEYYHTSPPTVAGDNLVVGGLVLDSQKLGLPSGVVRAFDATTGAFSWAWDMGNPGYYGEPAEGETYTPGTPNVWSVMSYDEELDLVYLPTGNANPDYYGGERRDFDEEWSSAIVALNGQTGEPRWKYQTVHHDVWDYDAPAQPVLVDVTLDGENVPAVALPTKMGSIFLLDRRDGTPVHPIPEVDVPQDPELGDFLSPTQPQSPLPNFHPYRYEADMWGLTPIDQMVCRIEYRMMRYEGMFTPPTRGGTLLAPGNFGGFNWGSVSVDADNGLLIAAPMLLAHRVLLATPEQVQEVGPRAAAVLGEDHPAVRMDENAPIQDLPEVDPNDPFDQMRVKYFGIPMPFMSRLGTAIPCFEPPWARIAVIDLNTKELLWSRPVGDMSAAGPFNLRSGLPIDVGTAVRAGTLTTRGGLTFISSTMDAKVRAYNVRTGEEEWASDLPGNGQSTPMSYRAPQSGRQTLIVTVPNPSWRYPRDPATNEYLDSQSVRDGKGGYVIAYALDDAD